MAKKYGIPLKELAEYSRKAAAEGIVLLKNEDGTLPMKKGETASLFGRCQINYVRSGTGSGGAVNVAYEVNALEGFRNCPGLGVNEELASLYEDWVRENPFDNGGGGWAAEPWFQKEMVLTDEVVSRAASRSDLAFVFIGRTAGEDQDNADSPGSYRLTPEEEDMILKTAARFSRVCLVMNTTNIMDMAWLETMDNRENIKAVLYSWAAGVEGGNGLADVVSGKVSPSGRLTDTVAYDLADYPSAKNFGSPERNVYEEDIYVGYRYFETFKPRAVQFPFGAGLSYTAFSRKGALSVKGEGADTVLTLAAEVTNIGKNYAGKEVVQVYAEAPQGKLGKPARVLVGFGKTKVLEPGESERLDIPVELDALASYDDSGATGHKSCTLLEAGTYRFYLGGSVREARALETEWTLEETVLLSRHREALAPVVEFNRLKPGQTGEDGSREALTERVPTGSIDLKKRIEEELPPDLAQTGFKGISLADVKEGKADWDAYLGQFGDEDLAALVRGEGMCSPKATPGVASVFGGVTTGLFKLGIPVACCSDGPSGIRMDSGHKATQVPIGTLLACTWNRELNEELFRLVGKELRSNEIDTLLGPGINIHRHPLNGRNFEYFSEDPLLTGEMAAAQCAGLVKAGVQGTVKHFAANDQETARVDVDSVVSERALREIHLKGFEWAVKRGGTKTIMTSYNPINGHWAASNYDLCTTILRGEWGYDGIVMTDWWAKMNDPAAAGGESKAYTSFMVRAQNDLYMVVENDGARLNAAGDDTLEALARGTLTRGELQRSARNICAFIMNAPAMDRELIPWDPVKTFAPLDGSGEGAVPLESGRAVPFDTGVNKTVAIRVTGAGQYALSAKVRYAMGSQAQSSCSLYVNGDFAVSLPVNGTDGEWVVREGLSVRLEKGLYELSLDFVKKGMEVGSVTLTRE